MAKITLADGMVIEGTAEELRELAKAFGEVAEETAPEPEETPQDVREGDYVVSSKSNVGITAGKPYKIDKVYSDGEFKFHDNDEDPRWRYVGDEDITIYRPIEGAPQVGDKILIVDAMHANGYYGNGDILTVIDYYFRGTVGKYVVDVDGDGPYLYREEFIIIERAGEEGVEETIGEGDLIRFTENFFGVKEGEIVEVVTGADIVGYIQYRDRDGEIWNAVPKRFELVAKKADRRDLADRKDV